LLSVFYEFHTSLYLRCALFTLGFLCLGEGDLASSDWVLLVEHLALLAWAAWALVLMLDANTFDYHKAERRHNLYDFAALTFVDA
jgi:hypothetical protein